MVRFPEVFEQLGAFASLDKIYEEFHLFINTYAYVSFTQEDVMNVCKYVYLNIGLEMHALEDKAKSLRASHLLYRRKKEDQEEGIRQKQKEIFAMSHSSMKPFREFLFTTLCQQLGFKCGMPRGVRLTTEEFNNVLERIFLGLSLANSKSEMIEGRLIVKPENNFVSHLTNVMGIYLGSHWLADQVAPGSDFRQQVGKYWDEVKDAAEWVSDKATSLW